MAPSVPCVVVMKDAASTATARVHSTSHRASGVVIVPVEECCLWSPSSLKRTYWIAFFQLFTKACLGRSADIFWILGLSLLPSETQQP